MWTWKFSNFQLSLLDPRIPDDSESLTKHFAEVSINPKIGFSDKVCSEVSNTNIQ